MKSPWITMKEAADELGVSTSTIRRLIDEGAFHAIRIGRQIRILDKERLVPPKKSLTVQELSRWWRVSESTIQRLLAQGLLPARRIRCSLRFPSPALMEFEDRQRIRTPPPRP